MIFKLGAFCQFASTNEFNSEMTSQIPRIRQQNIGLFTLGKAKKVGLSRPKTMATEIY